jgi:flagellar biosynthesis GTPase FlhF
MEERAPLIAELQQRRIQPKPDAVAVLQGVLYLLGFTKQQLGDPYSSDPVAFNWNIARKHLGSEFLAAIRSFDPSAIQKLAKHQLSEPIRALVGGLSVEELNKQNAAFGSLLWYLNCALEFREAAAAKRKREADEEAERKRKHEEEVAMKAAADAEAAAEREAAEKEAAEKEAADTQSAAEKADEPEGEPAAE